MYKSIDVHEFMKMGLFILTSDSLNLSGSQWCL
jgi:hypothetical protein